MTSSRWRTTQRATFDAVIIDQNDGICSRTWKFRVSGEEITLIHHDDLGNYFKSAGPEPDILKWIVADLVKRLATYAARLDGN